MIDAKCLSLKWWRYHAIRSILIVFLIGNLFIGTCGADWISVPIRSVAQKKAGYAGGEGMQYVMCIKYSASNPMIAYFGVDTSQVWKSTDGGFSWRNLRGKEFVAHGARSLAIDPTNPDIVIAAGFGGYKAPKKGKTDKTFSGIYRSRNGGQTWELVRQTTFFKQDGLGDLLAFDTSSITRAGASTAIAGSYDDGLLRSEDAGKTWKVVALTGESIRDIKEIPSQPGKFLVVTDKGIYHYGSRAVMRGKGLPEPPLSIWISKQPAGIVYAAVGTHGIYKSEDDAVHFNRASKGLIPGLQYSNVACDSIDGNIVYASANRFSGKTFYSADGAKTWQYSKNTDVGALSLSDHHYWQSPIAPHPTKAAEALTAKNGQARILRTKDGGQNWAYSGDGFTGGHAASIHFFKDSPKKMMFGLTDHGLWFTKDGGATFKKINTPRVFGSESVGSVTVSGNTIVASVGTWKKKALVLSKDFGKSWQIHRKKVLNGAVKWHPQNNAVIYAGQYRSDDGGDSWQALPHAVKCVYPANGDIVYSAEKSINGQIVVKQSVDRGTTWKMLSIAPAYWNGMGNMAVSPNKPNNVYLAHWSGVMVWDGSKWITRKAENGLKKDYFNNAAVRWVAVDPNHPKILYAGRHSSGFGKSNGIFISQDGSKTWKNINNNLGTVLTVFNVFVNPHDSSPYLGTQMGTWKSLFPPCHINSAK